MARVLLRTLASVVVFGASGCGLLLGLDPDGARVNGGSEGGTLPDGGVIPDPDGSVGAKSCDGGGIAPVDTANLRTIAAGGVQNCAIAPSGALKCWGGNPAGQVGTPATGTEVSTPVAITGLPASISSVTAGGSHTCALSTTGEVFCWGANHKGQLGRPLTTGSSPNPASVADNVAAIVAGMDHTCLLKSTGSVQCFGDNPSGQLGDGTTTATFKPQTVADLPAANAIAAGTAHTCALTNEGGVKCWGNNSYGQLGDGTFALSMTPVDVAGLKTGVVALAAKGDHACAITASGVLKCWGANTNGTLGDGTTSSAGVPVDVSLPCGAATAVAVGDDHTCAITVGGNVMCWGSNAFGQIGTGVKGRTLLPASPIGVSSISAIAAGQMHTCAKTTAGSLKCWGHNNFGQLGNGTTSDPVTAVDVTGFP